jgi:hypothetical protein
MPLPAMDSSARKFLSEAEEVMAARPAGREPSHSRRGGRLVTMTISTGIKRGGRLVTWTIPAVVDRCV